MSDAPATPETPKSLRYGFYHTSPAEAPLEDEAEHQPPIHETPRKEPQVDVHQDFQTQMRERIGDYMNDEILCCKVKVFQTSYLPEPQLSKEEYAIIYDAGLKKARSRFNLKKNQSLAFNNEVDLSIRLRDVVEALRKAPTDGDARPNLFFSADPNKAVISSIVGGNFKIDSSLTNVAGSLHTTNTVVAKELKLHRNYDTVRKNRQQLVSDILHILNDDVRRMFMFGITIEAHRMTLWYFSRSHSIKSQSFDFVEHPEILVEVLISLVFADDQDLGFDPNIALKSNASRQYIYTVHSDAGPRRFLTTHSIFENRALTAAGRMTRVFRVVELDGQTDSPKEGAKPMVLKDVWLDKDSKTEMEIQEELFADIHKFAENPDWRSHPCLSGFNQDEHTEIIEAFGELLQKERYKDLFLVIRDGSTGECSKPSVSSAWRSKSKIFFSALNPPAPDNDLFVTSQRTSEPQSNATRDLQIRPADEATQPAYRTFASKRRSFLIFDEECTRLYCLSTVGDVFTVLRDCITALRLMFCAGWVHRDISCNNIMAVRDSETQQWKVKLADLEYSKKYGLNAGTSDPKTGTPFFMPCEILRRKYFGLNPLNPDALSGQVTLDLTSDDDTSDDGTSVDVIPVDPSDEPLLHNFLHDLEATFWTGLWIITSRVNHEPSKNYALNIFKNTPTLTLPQSRLDAFESSIHKPLARCLLAQLKRLARIFEVLRTSLHTSATWLGEERAWRTDSGHQRYANLHSRFAIIFAVLADPQAAWAAIKLQLPTSSSPRPMDAIAEKDSKEPRVAPRSEEEEKETAEEEKEEGEEEEEERSLRQEWGAKGHLRRVKPRDPDEEAPAPADVPPASGRKRSHHEGEQAYDDDSEGRSSNSKRVKSNDGGRVSASGPSGASTSAGGGARYTLRSRTDFKQGGRGLRRK